MNDFVKVFDIADSGFRSVGFAAFGLIFIVVGFLMFFFPKVLVKLKLQKAKKRPLIQTIFFFFFIGFSIFWTVMVSISTYGEYKELKESEYKVVEGKVENFDFMPYGGHKDESYSVQGVKFRYSDYSVTNGFNHTASHGGPVKHDSIVRIYYVPRGNLNIITRLEVKDYKGPLNDYSWDFGPLGMFKDLSETSNSSSADMSKMQDKMVEQLEKSMFVIMSLFVIEFTMFALFYLPYFNTYFKVRLIEHEPLAIDLKYLNKEKHTFDNLTVKYDGEGALWGRAYGTELFNMPGFALKMYLSKDKKEVIKSEVRISSLMLITSIVFAFMAMTFFMGTIKDDSNFPKDMSIIAYAMFPMILVQFWILKLRFQKRIMPLLKRNL